MDGLAPPLKLCLNLRYALENGKSVYAAVKTLMPVLDESLRRDISLVLAAQERGSSPAASELTSRSQYRRALIELVAAGLRGEPILKQLREIEDELKSACEHDIELFVARLPMKTLVPLLLIQFPAFLILVLGPILNEMIKELAR